MLINVMLIKKTYILLKIKRKFQKRIKPFVFLGGGVFIYENNKT